MIDWKIFCPVAEVGEVAIVNWFEDWTSTAALRCSFDNLSMSAHEPQIELEAAAKDFLQAEIKAI